MHALTTVHTECVSHTTYRRSLDSLDSDEAEYVLISSEADRWLLEVTSQLSVSTPN